MRVACDTNVLVRGAVRPAGPARSVLVEGIASSHVFVLSQQIVDEVSKVLRYERVRQQARLTDAEIDEFIASLLDLAEMVSLGEPIPSVTVDSDDDFIVATAVQGRADAICTRDRHLRHRLVQAYCATFGIRVLTDLEVLAEFRRRT